MKRAFQSDESFLADGGFISMSPCASTNLQEEHTPFLDLLQLFVERIHEEHEREIFLVRRAFEDTCHEVDRLRLAHEYKGHAENRSGTAGRSKMSKLRGSGNRLFSALFHHSIHTNGEGAREKSLSCAEPRPSENSSCVKSYKAKNFTELNDAAAEYVLRTSQQAQHTHCNGNPIAMGDTDNMGSYNGATWTTLMPQDQQAKENGLAEDVEASTHLLGGDCDKVGAEMHQIHKPPGLLSGLSQAAEAETGRVNSERATGESNDACDISVDAPNEVPPAAPPLDPEPDAPHSTPPLLPSAEQPSDSIQEDDGHPAGHCLTPRQACANGQDQSSSSMELSSVERLTGSSSVRNHMLATQRSMDHAKRASNGSGSTTGDVYEGVGGGGSEKSTPRTSTCCGSEKSTPRASNCSMLGGPQLRVSTSGGLNAISEDHEQLEEPGQEATHDKPLTFCNSQDSMGADGMTLSSPENNSTGSGKSPMVHHVSTANRVLPRVVGWQEKDKKGSILKKDAGNPKEGNRKKSRGMPSILWAPETDEQEAQAKQKEEARKSEFEVHQVRPRWDVADAKGPVLTTGQSRASVWARMDEWTAATNSAQLQEMTSIQRIRSNIAFMDRLISHPNSTYNFYFDIFSFVLVGYDFVMVPLQVFDPEQNAFMEMMMAISTLWWTFDCFRNFGMGYYSHGEVVMSFWCICRKYLCTWFLIDAAIVGFDWTYQVMKYSNQSEQDNDTARLFRSLRNIRGLRLLRGIKANRLLKMFEDRIHSESLSVIFTMAKLFSAILILNHIIACIWYLIGKSCQDMPNWIEEHLVEIQTGQRFFYQYSTSFHWALTQFTPASISVQPYNFFERFFAIIVLLFALVTVSTFVSGITSAVMQLRSMRSAKSKQLWLLRRYLSQCNVPTPLAVRINNYCDYAWGANEMRLQERNIQILTLLSQSLRAELKAAIFEPRIAKHAFFVLLGKVAPLTTRALCSTAVSRIEVGRGDQLFACGDTANEMYFLSMGELIYYHHDVVESAEILFEDSWFCEPVLWTSWIYQGTLQAKTESVLSAVDAEKFGDIVQANYESRKEAAAYAKGFIQGLNRVDATKMSDLYTTPLVEGLWFRLLNEFQMKRSTVKRSRHASNLDNSFWSKLKRIVFRQNNADIEPFSGPVRHSG